MPVIPMNCRADEIEAAVDSTVYDVTSVQATLVVQELLKLSINVLHYCLEAEHWKHIHKNKYNFFQNLHLKWPKTHQYQFKKNTT